MGHYPVVPEAGGAQLHINTWQTGGSKIPPMVSMLIDKTTGGYNYSEHYDSIIHYLD